MLLPSQLDVDGSGMIELPELHKALSRLGAPVSRDAATAFFRVNLRRAENHSVLLLVHFCSLFDFGLSKIERAARDHALPILQH